MTASVACLFRLDFRMTSPKNREFVHNFILKTFHVSFFQCKTELNMINLIFPFNFHQQKFKNSNI